MSNLGLERLSRGAGPRADPRADQGRRSPCARSDARASGYQCRRRAIGAYHPVSDYATTGDGLVAGLQILAEIMVAVGGKPASQVLHLLRAAAAAAQERPLRSCRAAARGGCRSARSDRRGARRVSTGRQGAAGDPPVGHRAGDPRHGRGRGHRRGDGGRRRHLRGGRGGGVVLDLRPDCEACGRDLPPGADARICSFECTFCPPCVERLAGICPNCGGGFERRPVRPAAALARSPASTGASFPRGVIPRILIVAGSDSSGGRASRPTSRR